MPMTWTVGIALPRDEVLFWPSPAWGGRRSLLGPPQRAATLRFAPGPPFHSGPPGAARLSAGLSGRKSPPTPLRGKARGF
jgi:hypothetical protein